jgi:ferric-dicitrate binding protein FerR (iron transport regulator)
VPRSRRASEREKAWWRSLTPAQRAKVDRENARRREQERKQREALCGVLIPAAVTAAGSLVKLAWAAKTVAGG